METRRPRRVRRQRQTGSPCRFSATENIDEEETPIRLLCFLLWKIRAGIATDAAQPRASWYLSHLWLKRIGIEPQISQMAQMIFYPSIRVIRVIRGAWLGPRPVLSAGPRNPPGIAAAQFLSSNALVLDSCIEDFPLFRLSPMFTPRDTTGHREPLPGIRFKTLAYGAKTLLTEFHLEKGRLLPRHSHPQEQTGYLISGAIRLTIGNQKFDAKPGDCWCIEGGVEHQAEIIEDSVAIEVFSPVRQEYLPDEK
jgi:quercetin dioxygenase-like cupin family protein